MSHFIEHIFYINLEHRTDRRAEIESELDAYGLKYERFNAFYTPPDGFIGCAQSHLAVLKLARERGYKNILIVEDDFKFVVSKEEFEGNFNSEVTKKVWESALAVVDDEEADAIIQNQIADELSTLLDEKE